MGLPKAIIRVALNDVGTYRRISALDLRKALTAVDALKENDDGVPLIFVARALRSALRDEFTAVILKVLLNAIAVRHACYRRSAF